MSPTTWWDRLLDSSFDLLTVHEADGTVRFSNAASERLLGFAPDEFIGSDPFRLVHPDDLDELIGAMLRLRDDAQAMHAFVIRVRHQDGTWRWLEAAAHNQLADPALHGVVVSWRDVTDRVLTEKALRESEEERNRADHRLRLLVASSAQGILGLDTDARLTFINDAAARILGLNPATALGRNGHQLFHHSHADGTPYDEKDCPCVAAARQGHPALGVAEVFWRSDGTPVPVDYRATPLLTDRHEGAVLTFDDVSERVRAEQERVRAEQERAAQAEFLTAVLDSLPAQTAVVDGQGTIVAVNHAWLRFMQERGGRLEACGPGANYFDVCRRVHGHDRAAALEAAEGLRAVLADQMLQFDTDVTYIWGDEEPLHFSLQMVPLDGPKTGAVVSYTDITIRKRLEIEAAHRATHDELTGLPNRTLLLDRVEHALRERDTSPLAVLFVDLDQFKLVNDGYGHEEGDRVLRQLAHRLVAAVRPSDTVARLAGDEFVILCERLPFLTEAYRLAQRVLTSIAEPFAVDDSTLTLGASIGIAEAEDRHVTAEELLRAADQAMFEAKARGRNQFAVYDDGVHRRSRQRVEQALALRRLVETDQLTVHYQPFVDLRDGRIIGVEALLRWHGEQRLPDAATSVALAEEIGLIGEIGRRVLREACQQAATFRQPDGSVLPLAVNLAPQQLDGFLVSFVTDAAEAADYPLTSLVLELTERTVMTDLTASLEVLRQLRDLGVRIAIDDFGVGYSSLAYLRDLPLDTLKIERDFIRALGVDSDDDRIIRAIIQLAGALELNVVAEGIERDDQRERLLDLGCTQGQGFLFSAAVPAEEIRQLTREPR